MSTDLEQRLRAALHEDALRARLVHPDGPPEPEVVPPSGVAGRRRSVRTLVAVAAVLVLLALAAAVTLSDGDQDLDTVPPVTEESIVTETTVSETTVRETTTTEPPQTESPSPLQSVQALPGRTIVSGSGCPFGISGEPVDLQPGPAGERFDTLAGQGVAHVVLGSQTAEVRVPGFDLIGEEGSHFAPVELGGRTAFVRLDGPASASGAGSPPYVQVRYLPTTDAPCSSFAVTVDGGSVDANRATAVDLAERMLLPEDLEDLDLPGTEGGPLAGLELPGTTWEISTPDGGPVTGAEMTFTGSTVRWTDGCASLTADYELDRVVGALVLRDMTSPDPGCAPPTPMISAVMDAERIGASFADSRLYLGEYACEVGCTGETLVLDQRSEG